MARLSFNQREALASLTAGWRLEFRSMVTARWVSQAGEFLGFPDMRSINGLWLRKLIELGERIPGAKDIRYFSLTDAGRDAVNEAQGK